MINFNDLTKNQQKAVLSNSKALRIVAGAGSGKTRVLTMRIAYLVNDMKINPDNILAITFTNKAAKEMKKRIEDMLGLESSKTTISTIHSLCASILRRDISIIGYPNNFTITDSEDQKTILRQAYREFGYSKSDYSYGSVLSYISNNKAAGISVEKAFEFAGSDNQEMDLANLYKYYEDNLRNNYALDFDDLIIKTVGIFKQYTKVLKKYSNKFQYILVDEFQDIDPLQYELIKLLSSTHNNVYVVGDPDQTIYSWRGADVNIILNFENDYENVETIVLDENFRSTGNILNGANCVIKNNQKRIDKQLYTNKGNGEKIIHASFANDTYEGDFVAEQISSFRSKGYKYEDIAILYRANYQSRAVEKALTRLHIPYVIYGGLRFYERAEVKDILSYLRMLNTADDLALIRTINQPRRGIGNKTIDSLRNDARARKSTIFEMLISDDYVISNKNIKSYVDIIKKLREDASRLPLERLLENVLNDTGYRLMIEKKDELDRLENIKELINDISEYQKNNPDSNLNEYLQMISLYTDKDTGDNFDVIKLMTIHSAKGLEFDVVFIIGLNEGVFPSDRSLKEGMSGLEEERRLAYVAYTRARKNLFLTESRDYSYVMGRSKTASRFINEIDDEFIIHNVPENDILPQKPIFTQNAFSEKTFKSKVTNKRPKIFKKGDYVKHNQFGLGVITSKDGDILSIAFEYPYGIKKILEKNAPLEKVKK